MSSSADSIHITIDGSTVTVRPRTCIAAAIWNHSARGTRRSVSGEPRAALCGMGICHECRITIDGIAHERGCMIECREGMDIQTTRQAAAAPLNSGASSET